MLGVALDEPRNGDVRYESGGCPFVVDDTLINVLQNYAPLTVDFDDRFFNPVRVLPAHSTRCC